MNKVYSYPFLLKNSIPFFEWIVIIFFSLCISSILFVSFFVHNKSSEIVVSYSRHNPIKVTVTGAVKSPGTHSFPYGVSLKTILKKTKRTFDADVSNKSMAIRYYEDVEIYIPRIDFFTFLVEGAVKAPGIVIIEPGTRVSDLKKIIELDHEADLSFFSSKRRIRNKEHIYIPFSSN